VADCCLFLKRKLSPITQFIPRRSGGFIKSVPTPVDLLVLLFLPFTPGNSILKSISALPLQKTTWHHCHSLLGFACSLPWHRWPVLVDCCYHVVLALIHVVPVDPDYHGLVSFHVAPGQFRLTQTIFVGFTCVPESKSSWFPGTLLTRRLD
jgi:hypothetical protein